MAKVTPLTWLGETHVLGVPTKAGLEILNGEYHFLIGEL